MGRPRNLSREDWYAGQAAGLKPLWPTVRMADGYDYPKWARTNARLPITMTKVTLEGSDIIEVKGAKRISVSSVPHLTYPAAYALDLSPSIDAKAHMHRELLLIDSESGGIYKLNCQLYHRQGLSCKCCMAHSLQRPCLVVSWSGPNPGTGLYPRTDASGEVENISLDTCYDCLIDGRKCDKVGMILDGPRVNKFLPSDKRQTRTINEMLDIPVFTTSMQKAYREGTASSSSKKRKSDSASLPTTPDVKRRLVLKVGGSSSPLTSATGTTAASPQTSFDIKQSPSHTPPSKAAAARVINARDIGFAGPSSPAESSAPSTPPDLGNGDEDDAVEDTTAQKAAVRAAIAAMEGSAHSAEAPMMSFEAPTAVAENEMEVETEENPSASRGGGYGARAESTPQRFEPVADETTEDVDIKPIIPDPDFDSIPTPPTATVVAAPQIAASPPVIPPPAAPPIVPPTEPAPLVAPVPANPVTLSSIIPGPSVAAPTTRIVTSSPVITPPAAPPIVPPTETAALVAPLPANTFIPSATMPGLSVPASIPSATPSTMPPTSSLTTFMALFAPESDMISEPTASLTAASPAPAPAAASPAVPSNGPGSASVDEPSAKPTSPAVGTIDKPTATSVGSEKTGVPSTHTPTPPAVPSIPTPTAEHVPRKPEDPPANAIAGPSTSTALIPHPTNLSASDYDLTTDPIQKFGSLFTRGIKVPGYIAEFQPACDVPGFLYPHNAANLGFDRWIPSPAQTLEPYTAGLVRLRSVRGLVALWLAFMYTHKDVQCTTCKAAGHTCVIVNWITPSPALGESASSSTSHPYLDACLCCRAVLSKPSDRLLKCSIAGRIMSGPQMGKKFVFDRTSLKHADRFCHDVDEARICTTSMKPSNKQRKPAVPVARAAPARHSVAAETPRPSNSVPPVPAAAPPVSASRSGSSSYPTPPGLHRVPYSFIPLLPGVRPPLSAGTSGSSSHPTPSGLHQVPHTSGPLLPGARPPPTAGTSGSSSHPTPSGLHRVPFTSVPPLPGGKPPLSTGSSGTPSYPTPLGLHRSPSTLVPPLPAAAPPPSASFSGSSSHPTPPEHARTSEVPSRPSEPKIDSSVSLTKPHVDTLSSAADILRARQGSQSSSDTLWERLLLAGTAPHPSSVSTLCSTAEEKAHSDSGRASISLDEKKVLLEESAEDSVKKQLSEEAEVEQGVTDDMALSDRSKDDERIGEAGALDELSTANPSESVQDKVNQALVDNDASEWQIRAEALARQNADLRREYETARAVDREALDKAKKTIALLERISDPQLINRLAKAKDDVVAERDVFAGELKTVQGLLAHSRDLAASRLVQLEKANEEVTTQVFLREEAEAREKGIQNRMLQFRLEAAKR